MKAVKAKLAPERVEAFEKGAAAFAKKVVGNFKDYEFVRTSLVQPAATHPLRQYIGENMNPDGMVALLNYRVRSPNAAVTLAYHRCTGGWRYA